MARSCFVFWSYALHAVPMGTESVVPFVVPFAVVPFAEGERGGFPLREAGVCVFLRVKFQRPGLVRVPVNTGGFVNVTVISALFAMTMSVAVNTAVVPASVACPTENRGLWREGMRWHSCFGSSGIGRNPFDAPRMMALFATVMAMPLGVGASCSSGVVPSARWMVHPVSAAMLATEAHVGLVVGRIASMLGREEGRRVVNELG